MSRKPIPHANTRPIRWKSQPGWARYAAMNPNGRWRVFKTCPVPSEHGWIADESFDADGREILAADMAQPPKWPMPPTADKDAIERAWRDWCAQWSDSIQRRDRPQSRPLAPEWENAMRVRKNIGVGTPMEAEYARTRGLTSPDMLTLVRLKNLGGVAWNVADTGDGLQVVLRGEDARKTFMSALAFILNTDA